MSTPRSMQPERAVESRTGGTGPRQGKGRGAGQTPGALAPDPAEEPVPTLTVPTSTEPVELSCTDTGDGRPVVLIHGWPLNRVLLDFLTR